MSGRYYTTAEIIEALEPGDRPTAFLRDTFFNGEAQLFPTDEVAFDKLKRDRTIAPYVSPAVAGRAETSRGREVKAIIPPYLKPKHEVTPSDTAPRSASEAYGGALEPIDRYEEMMLDNFQREEYSITRAEEMQCAQILQTGGFVATGEDHPDIHIDYGRKPSQSIALTDGVRWGEIGVSIDEYLTMWADLVQKNSTGIVTKLVVGIGAGGLLRRDPVIREGLDNRRQMGGEMQLGPVATGAEDMVAAYLGHYGQYEIWQYSQYFTDTNGNEVNVWPDYGVGIVAEHRLGGLMVYGAIKDNKGLKPMRRFPKHWGQDDPSVDFTMTQSAPVAVARDVDASLFALVR